MDELPRSILQGVGGHALASLVCLLGGQGAGGELLCTVLHIPLAKKQPAWLLRNLRPVLLEACLKRVETKIRFRRLMHRLEARGLVPSEMYAYRRQLPGPLADMTMR